MADDGRNAYDGNLSRSSSRAAFTHLKAAYRLNEHQLLGGINLQSCNNYAADIHTVRFNRSHGTVLGSGEKVYEARRRQTSSEPV